MATIDEIRSVLAEQRSALMQKPNVAATGIGYKITDARRTDELAIICSVDSKSPAAALGTKEMIPPAMNGITTDVVATGPLTVFQDRISRHRPAPGGVSIGHIHITAGTLGCLVTKNGTRYILSNNHVLANSNDASRGDPILQPGPADGGSRTSDEIARLSEYVPIVFEDEGNTGAGCPVAGFIAAVLNALAAITGSRTRLRQYRVAAAGNTVDCAIAEPRDPAYVVDEILEIGTIGSIGEGELGMEVKKSGRTTGLTTGVIRQIEVTARVNFGSGRVAVFEDQLMAGGMSQGGDSGSVVTDFRNNAVGLLFAGSATSTVINRIQNVLSALNVTLP